MEQFGRRLRQERERLGLSAAEAADACGIARSTQGKYELGGSCPDAAYLGKFDSLGGDSVFIVTGERQEARAAAHFDWKLLGRILKVADELERRDGSLPPERKIDLLCVAYKALIQSPEPALELIPEFYKLASNG